VWSSTLCLSSTANLFLNSRNHLFDRLSVRSGWLPASGGIYVAYLLFLMSKLARLKKEAAELGA
jgi:hypothetical protein